MIEENHFTTGLTVREYQILELVAQGYSAKEIAQRIDIAPRTVERHIDNVRLKLRARNRTHMVARAIAGQLLTAEGRRMADPTNGMIVIGDKAATQPEAPNIGYLSKLPGESDQGNRKFLN